MFDKCISVIVPIFNVEKYLKKCIESLINQSYTNLEIILVDDGSPDNCGKICEDYALKDRRVKVIHKPNGGLSDARNVGIDKATGAFIGFVDSDDYIHPSMYEILMRDLMQTGSDISVCNFLKVYENQSRQENDHAADCPSVTKVYNNIEALSNIFSPSYIPTVIPWNKLYKKELFDGIRYPVGKNHEDEFTTYKLIHKANKVVYTEAQLYYYLQRDDSIMGRKFNIKRLQALDAFKERTEFFKAENYEDLFVKSAFSYMRAIARYYLILQEAGSNDDILKSLRQRFIFEYKSINIKKKLLPIERINLWSFYVNPLLCKVLMKMNPKCQSIDKASVIAPVKKETKSNG